MSRIDKFWQEVALEIERTYGKGHPSKWNKRQIDRFLKHMEERVVEKCKGDSEAVSILKLPQVEGIPQCNAVRVPTYHTFRRIFIKKHSTGSPYSQNLFAIFLGYPSVEAYLAVRGITVEESLDNSERTEELKAFQGPRRDQFFRILLKKAYGWMICWMICSTLVHNLFGILKGNVFFPFWRYLFWIPPIVIGIFLNWVGRVFIQHSPSKLKHLSLIWWLGISLQIAINQKIPGWIHFIETAGLFIIGMIGQAGLSTKLSLISDQKSALFNARYHLIAIYKYDINATIFSYFLGLCFGFLFMAIMWIVPDHAIGPYSDNLILFRLNCSMEMLTAFIFISVGFRRLIFRPILTLSMS